MGQYFKNALNCVLKKLFFYVCAHKFKNTTDNVANDDENWL